MEILMLPPVVTAAAPFDRSRYVRAISTSRDSPSTTSPSSSSPDLTHDTTDDQGVTPDSEEDLATTPDTVVPKIEEQDDHHALAGLTIDAKPAILDIQQQPQPQPQLHSFGQAQPNAPRKRGRPRKHPIVEQKKTTHARSKTGCGTCRKRKKKCDETKPSCMNCEKNNVVCDGYEPKKPWRPGKQKTIIQRLPIPTELPLLIEGIECDTDRLLFDFFARQISKVLSLTDDRGSSPFLKIIVPMSFEYGGLMHSVLYLSGTCMLASAKDVSPNLEWQSRFEYHSDKAVSKLREGIRATIQEDEVAGKSVASASFNMSIAQTLILCLQTVCEGDTTGNFRIHLDAMKRMLSMQKGFLPSEELRQFVLEFLLYHDHSDSITNLGHNYDPRSIALMEDFKLPEYMISHQAGNLLGVLDGIFGYISRIRRLRDAVRHSRRSGQGHWWEDRRNTEEAFAIDKALREWQSIHQKGTSRYKASLLYRLCTWIYLERTITASRPSLLMRNAVDNGLSLLQQLDWNEDNGSMPSILLMPLFLLGCAAFEQHQRPPLQETFKRLQDWSSLGNIRKARDVVEEIWQKMDAGLEQETWDWEQLILDRGWDFLVT